MKIVIINCHWDNRGDEAAIRAMIDELQAKYPEADFHVQRAIGEFGTFPLNDQIHILPPFPVGGKMRFIPEAVSYMTNGNINLTESGKAFYSALKGAEIVIHAPGGPSIGDIYIRQEKNKLYRLLMVRRTGVKYAFYAPSMGPFENKRRNLKRKKVLEKASLIVLREEISKKYVENFVPTCKPIVTLDSAFQHDMNKEENQAILEKYKELNDFINCEEKIIALTITDLQWNQLYKNDGKTSSIIKETFTDFIDYLLGAGYRILFIPQLFGASNDSEYMKSFAKEGCYVVSDKYDCYFQQYVISKIHAVVGMRYHSNIFSAKMGVPFISISYEQKMQGFMTKAELNEYCIKISELSFSLLKVKFKTLENNYEQYRFYLSSMLSEFRRQSGETTNLICNLIASSEKN